MPSSRRANASASSSSESVSSLRGGGRGGARSGSQWLSFGFTLTRSASVFASTSAMNASYSSWFRASGLRQMGHRQCLQ